MNDKTLREKTIIRTSIIGILTNLLLAAAKSVAGLMVHSISMVLDGVNNFSDVLSSVVTILGTKLAAKKPDKKHPLGHGRIEYLSTMVVSALVLYAGITALVESIGKILRPESPDYTTLSLVIMGTAILIKICLGLYVSAKGRSVDSGALTASGADALFDAILSASVLASALIFLFFGISLEAYVGALISLFILKAGFSMMGETASLLLGQRVTPELSHKIKGLLCEEPDVLGAYDLVINNYGPGMNYASVHLELPDSYTVEQLDTLTRRLEEKVYAQTGVMLTGVSVYAHNTRDQEVERLRSHVQEIVLSHDYVLQFHGFYLNRTAKDLRFDAVLDFAVAPKAAIEHLTQEIQALYPDYRITITPDVDLSD